MQAMHLKDLIKAALVQEKDDFRYYRMKMTWFAHILDSTESIKMVSFANVEETQQKGLIF